jgi:hypothetical protein
MLGLSVQTEDRTRRVANAASAATFRNLGHAAARIAKDAKASLETAEGPSPPGSPPHTHKGAFLRRAVRYAASKEEAIVGPQASLVGEVGAAHEFGEEYRGQEYPERAFMGPALEANEPRFAESWRGSIGE